MLETVFDNKTRLWLYILSAIVFATLQTLSLLPLIQVEWTFLAFFVFIQSVFLALNGVLLKLTLKFGKFESLPYFQQVINYITLILLFVAVTVGAGYGINIWLLGDKLKNIFEPLLPLNAFITLLTVLVLIYFFRQKNQEEPEEEITVAVSEMAEPSDEKSEVAATEILERIAVKSGQKIHVIMIPEIVYLQADGDYVHIFTMQGKYLKEQTMKYFEEHLPVTGFVRVHRSCIVNVEAISRIDLYEKQTQQLTLKNGHQIKVSQAGYKLLRSKLSL